MHGDHQSLWIDPTDGDYILSGSDGGYQVSFDGGINYHIFRNVVLSQFYQIFHDDRDPYWVCGGLQDNGNWCGPSRSKAGVILNDDWYTVSGGDGFYTVPVPGQPNLVYSNAQGGYFTITDTDTGRARSIPPYPRMIGSQGQGMFQARYRFNWDAPIHISPHDPNVTYWGGNVLFKSDDQYYTWEIISPDLTTDDPAKQGDSGGEIYNDNTAAEFHTTILTVAESPVEEGVIWVGTDDGNVQVTRTGGGTEDGDWTLINANIPNFPAEAWVSKIDASSHVAGRAYITSTSTGSTTSRRMCGAATITAPPASICRPACRRTTTPRSSVRIPATRTYSTSVWSRVCSCRSTAVRPGPTFASTCRACRCATSRSTRATTT